MKKIFKIVTPVLLIGILCIMGYKVISEINHKKGVVENIQIMPQFSYQEINGNEFSNENLKNNTPTLFVYFNSECEFCNHEAEIIKENIVDFKDIQIVFISFEKPDGIKFFAQKHKLLNYDSVHFIYDIKADFATTFDVKSLPSLVLYDKNQKLVELFKGQVKAETILKRVNEQ